GPLWATGGYTLSYLADNKKLGILGRTSSVFGKDGTTPSPVAFSTAVADFFTEELGCCGRFQ
ncbi:MAG: hypothetical protein GY826_07125, partial [Fuerstiella sp.]|nr:hypothetical protein [Fuerstiella sp.]